LIVVFDSVVEVDVNLASGNFEESLLVVFQFFELLLDDKKSGTVPARLGSGLLASLPPLTTGSIAKSNVLKGSAPS
jgi:hypothetical protein